MDAPSYNDEVIRPLDNPLIADGGICILRGNLAPRGAVLKPSAASPELLKHRGRAVVFENLEHYKERIVDESLDVDASSVLVMKNCGPKGYPGMAEVGNMGLPPKLLRQGVKDMVRISDARMSGTAYGTVVLHVAPEAADGGPLAVVRDGDWIELDCARGPAAPGHRRCRTGRAAVVGAPQPTQRRHAAAATSACTSITCCRPTKAATSTSWSAAAAPRSLAIRTEGRLRCLAVMAKTVGDLPGRDRRCREPRHPAILNGDGLVEAPCPFQRRAVRYLARDARHRCLQADA